MLQTILTCALTCTALSLTAVEIPLDRSLRDPSICRGPEGLYYLTGTTAADDTNDFNNCPGAHVWTSSDLITWTDHGLVWDLTTDLGLDHGRAVASWQTELYPVPGQETGKRARGFTSPRILFSKEHFWLSYSLSGYGAGVLVSSDPDLTSLVDGPQTAEVGGSPAARSDAMVFADTDGTRYLVWGGGVLAELASAQDLSRPYGRSSYKPTERLVSDTRCFLPAAIKGYFSDTDQAAQGEPYGAFLLHDGTHYRFIYTAQTLRDGGIHADAYIASADQLRGPYSPAQRFAADAGRVTAFQDTDGAWQVLFSVNNQPRIETVDAHWTLPNWTPPKLRPMATPDLTRPIATAAPALPATDKPDNLRQLIDMITPSLEHPLRDAALSQGPDGTWYLCGTEASQNPDGSLDWSVNTGIRLWSSTDREDWTDLGYVWTFAKNGTDWQTQTQLDITLGGQARLGRAITAPELHFIGDVPTIVYSLNGTRIGIMQSTDSVQGPYTDLGPIVNGRDGSLLIDDGQAHLVWGAGYVAALSADLKRIDGPVTSLFAQALRFPLQLRRMEILNQWGSQLVKIDGMYLWISAARTGRLGINAIDTVASWSESLAGPWCEPCLMIPNGGQSTLTGNNQNGWLATVSGEDEYAAHPYLPAITGVVGNNASKTLSFDMRAHRSVSGTAAYGAVQSAQATELDLFIGHPDMIPGPMRDIFMIHAEDGNYYCTGSPWSYPEFMDQVTLWRSRDAKHWEPLTGLFNNEELKKIEGFDAKRFDAIRDGEVTRGKAKKTVRHQWGEMKLFKLFGDWYMAIQLFNSFGGYLIKSTSDLPTGPYKIVRELPVPADFSVDEKGNVAFISSRGIMPFASQDELDSSERLSMNNSSQFWPGNPGIIPDGGRWMEDSEIGLHPIKDHYLLWSTDWTGNYDMNYTTARSKSGPWTPILRILPHGGNGNLFHDHDGRWWYAYFNNTNDVATRHATIVRMNLYPLTLSDQGEHLIIEPDRLIANRRRLQRLGALWQRAR